MRMKLHVAQHTRQRMERVGHALAIRRAVGIRHVGVKRQFQKFRQPPGLMLRISDKALEEHDMPALLRDGFQKPEDVSMAHRPHRFRQLLDCEAVRTREKGREEYMELGFLERCDHRAGMAYEVDVPGVLKILLRPVQGCRVERVCRRLLGENRVAQPFLEAAVEGLDGQVFGFGFGHETLRLSSVAPLDFHDRTNRSLQPEAVAVRVEYGLRSARVL